METARPSVELLRRAANIIANNGQAGVNVANGAGNAILGNSIFSNGNLGINLGPAVSRHERRWRRRPRRQQPPELPGAGGGGRRCAGNASTARRTARSPSSYYGNTACDPSRNGEGQTFLGSASVTTDANGNATLPLFTAAAGLIVTATATSATNDTSEFSACVTALAPASADLSLTMSDSDDPVVPGTSFNYVLVAHNAGPGAATRVS